MVSSIIVIVVFGFVVLFTGLNTKGLINNYRVNKVEQRLLNHHSDEDIFSLEKELTSNNKSVLTYYELGMIKLMKSSKQDAKKVFLEGINFDNTFAPMYYNLALIERQEGNYSKSKEYAQKAYDLEKVEKYKKQLLQLSSDKDIPKYATNLVYLTGAKYESDVDYAVLYSILNKQPKRANVYFFVHINVVDEPYKREYKVTKFSDKKIFKITFNLGFREHQRINMFMYQVIDDLLKNKELDLQPTKYNLRGKAESVGDFRFVLINEVLGNNNGLTSFDSFIMSLRLKLKRITVTPEKWFGLDTSIITKEAVPLNVIQIKEKKLKRIN